MLLLTKGDTQRVDCHINMDPSRVGHREDSTEESDYIDYCDQ